METPERGGTPGIDIFKIAGKSISGSVPSRRTGDPERIKMPYASTVEERLSIYPEYHPHVRTYQRGDISKAFAKAYNLATPLGMPYRMKRQSYGRAGFNLLRHRVLVRSA